jgi:hypothetical protein
MSMLALPLELAARPRTWEDFQGAEQLVSRLREVVYGDKQLVVVVIYGKSGRGKTTLCKIVGTNSAVFQEINASSERKGEDLRDAFDCFMAAAASATHSHAQGAAAGVTPGAAAGVTPALPPATLFMDEADGLGPVGQLTTASFIAMLQRKKITMLPVRILLACNDVALMDKGILQRADLVAEMPRPSREDLIAAGRRAAAAAAMPATAAEMPAILEPAEAFTLASRSAGGDFRSMLQMVELSFVQQPNESTNSLVCPREFAESLMKSLADAEAETMHLLDLVSTYWNKGFRDDVLIVWVEQVITIKMKDEFKHALLCIIFDLQHIQPVSLLQVHGVFVRNARAVGRGWARS